MNKVFVLVLSILLLCAVPLSAQQKKVVFLKFSKKDGLTRVVFEGDESLINRIKVTTLPSQIRLEFPENLDLKSEKGLPFEIIPSEKAVEINLKETAGIKFFRLSAPARLVLDIQNKESIAEKQPGKTPEKQIDKKAPEIISPKIVIDAGHGGYDFGITDGNISEKDINLAIARDLGAALTKKGGKVFFIRKADQYVPISDRTHFVNQIAPDIFISLHVSMSQHFILYEPIIYEQGANDYGIASSQKKYAGKSIELSDSIEKAIRNEFKAVVIRRKLPLPLLHSVRAPSVLLEYPSPNTVTYDKQMKTRLINAIINGITTHIP